MSNPAANPDLAFAETLRRGWKAADALRGQVDAAEYKHVVLGKLGGEFFTPRFIVRLLVEMLEPFDGRVYDPCCGSGGMFVQSEQFAKVAHGSTKSTSELSWDSELLTQPAIASASYANTSIGVNRRATARDQVPPRCSESSRISRFRNR
jgi:hypothetical protein